MASFVQALKTHGDNPSRVSEADSGLPELAEAEAVLLGLARVFSAAPANLSEGLRSSADDGHASQREVTGPNLEAKYRALLEQVPAIVFMAYLDRGISEAYVSPEIESVVGYSRAEWLEDPVPVVSDAHGLMSALQLWATEVEDLFGISCRFECDRPVLIHDDNMATQLYHIAQEAVNNAIKHGEARNIAIQLTSAPGRGRLMIMDDGKGIPDGIASSSGIVLHIMQYRSGMIGGSLEIRRGLKKGTVVHCTFPVKGCG